MNDRTPPILHRTSRSIPSEPTGALATLADGFSLVLARPWLMVLPVLVDLILWLGIQISIQPFTTPFARLLREDGGSNGDEASRQMLAIGEHVRLNDLAGIFVPSVFSGLPRDNAFNWVLSALFPQLTAGIDRERMYRDWGSGLFDTWFPPHWVSVVTLAMVLLVLASLLVIAFRVPIARQVRFAFGEPARETGFHEAPMAWVRLVGLLGLGVLVVVALIVPLVVLAGLMLVFGAGLVFLIAFGLFGIGTMGAIYVYFALDIALLDRLGPIDAIRSSIRMVRGRFGECARFAIACAVIQTGLLRVWQPLTESAPGIAVSLLVNAFIGAGIVAATMLFIARRPHRAVPPRQVRR
ncbi:MAG: hypothetical protein ACTHQE_14135 [Thermomicrobiales bacterium]